MLWLSGPSPPPAAPSVPTAVMKSSCSCSKQAASLQLPKGFTRVYSESGMPVWACGCKAEIPFVVGRSASQTHGERREGSGQANEAVCSAQTPLSLTSIECHMAGVQLTASAPSVFMTPTVFISRWHDMICIDQELDIPTFAASTNPTRRCYS